MSEDHHLAIVTGTSTGIGYELAKLCAANGFDLIVVANEPLGDALGDPRREGAVIVEEVETDLVTIEGND